MVLFPRTMSDSYVPQTTTFSTFCVALHIFITYRDRECKFGKLIDHRKL